MLGVRLTKQPLIHRYTPRIGFGNYVFSLRSERTRPFPYSVLATALHNGLHLYFKAEFPELQIAGPTMVSSTNTQIHLENLAIIQKSMSPKPIFY